MEECWKLFRLEKTIKKLGIGVMNWMMFVIESVMYESDDIKED